MDKRLVLIGIIVVVLIAVFFLIQKPTETTKPTTGRCGDGICGPLEKANPNLCPQDCTTGQQTGYTLIKDLAYSSDSPSQKLDLYLPKGESGKVPLILQIHGGGFEAGDKFPCEAAGFFTANGYAVASLNYRLSKEAIFPAAVLDVKSAVRWLRANADAYHLDSENFGVIGQSAGGYFSAFLGTTGDIHGFDVGNNLGYSSAVKVSVDEYGIGNFSSLVPGRTRARLNSSKVETAFIGCNIASPDCRDAVNASPITYVTSDDPPFLILHGENDTQIPVAQSKEFYAALQRAGVESELILIPNAGHGGPEFINYNSQILAFFDKHLKAHAPVVVSGVPHYFIVFHINPVAVVDPASAKDADIESKSYETLKKEVEYANKYNIKLSLWFGAAIADYISKDPVKLAEVKKWMDAGNEIGLHHHSTYRQAEWDGYTSMPEQQAIAARISINGGNVEPWGYLGTLDDLMNIIKKLNPDADSGICSEQFNKNDALPNDIIYLTGSGFSNNGEPGRFVDNDGDINAAINEYITTGIVNGIKRYWLTHYQINEPAFESTAETAFSGADPKIAFGVLSENSPSEFKEFVDFLHSKDPEGKNSMTVSQVIKSGILPENQVAFRCEALNGTVCEPKKGLDCKGSLLIDEGQYHCCSSGCVKAK